MPFLNKAANCPCGGPSYATCCGPCIDGDAIAPSAAKLMRSRYSAYALRNEAYLRATWHPSTCPPEAILSEAENLRWLGLEVRSNAALATHPDQDSVEFVARYKINGRAQRLHEVSRFVREGEGSGKRWFYLDGSFPK